MNDDKLVTTINNVELPREECKYIKNNWHKIGDPTVQDSGDCYLINDRYWRNSTGKIVYNHSVGAYVIKNDELIEGIINVNDEGLVKGYFNRNGINSVTVYDSELRPYTALSEDVFNNTNLYREVLNTGEFKHISTVNAQEFTKIAVVGNGIKRNLPYSCDGVMNEYMDKYNANEPNRYAHSESISNYLEDLTFGVEFESTAGLVPPRKTDKLGLIPLRDGSVAGLEYVTIPLSGEKGVNSLIESCNALKKYTTLNDTCSIHIHIGNVPRTKEFMIAFFKVMHIVQDDLFKMFPIYKKYNFGVKRKNYTKPLPNYVMTSMDKTINKDNIDENWDVLYKWLSGGQRYVGNYNNLDEIGRHPHDPRGNQKWHIKSRYHHVNLIPLVFGNKKTVEFRIHTPTFDVNKVVNFLLLCGTLVNFVKKQQNVILEDIASVNQFSLTQLINRYRPNRNGGNIKDELIRYISRKKDYIKSRNWEGDIRADESKFIYRSHNKWDIRKHPNEIQEVNFNVGVEELRAELLGRIGGDIAIEPLQEFNP